jgi:hypothetical protein
MKRFVIGSVSQCSHSSSVLVTGEPARQPPQVKVILLAETTGEASMQSRTTPTAWAWLPALGKVDYSRIPAPLTPAAQTALLQAIDRSQCDRRVPGQLAVIALQPTIEVRHPDVPLSSGEQTIATGPSGAPTCS